MSHLDQLQIAKLANLRDIDGGAGVTIALLDSGVSRSPALPASRVICLNHLGKPNITTVGQHGTLCAGLLASEHATARGVTPNARVLSYLVTMASGTLSPSRVEAAVADAIDKGADVLSCSFTLTRLGPELESVFRRAIASGVVVVAATDIDAQHRPFPDRLRSALVVGPATESGRIPRGLPLSEHVDVLAPGTNLLTVRGDGRKVRWEGPNSSGPTALVAGVAALLLALARGDRRRQLGRTLPGLIAATAAPIPNASPSTPGLIRPVTALAAARAFLAEL